METKFQRDYKQFKKLLANYKKVPAQQIRPDSHLKNELGFSSIELNQLTLELEVTFGVKLRYVNESQISTVGQITDYIFYHGNK